MRIIRDEWLPPTVAEGGPVRIIRDEWLPPNTAVVSPDVYEFIREHLSIEAKDAAFLRFLGIEPENKPTSDGT